MVLFVETRPGGLSFPVLDITTIVLVTGSNPGNGTVLFNISASPTSPQTSDALRN